MFNAKELNPHLLPHIAFFIRGAADKLEVPAQPSHFRAVRGGNVAMSVCRTWSCGTTNEQYAEKNAEAMTFTHFLQSHLAPQAMISCPPVFTNPCKWSRNKYA
jgi:hypothetical protein